MTRFEGDDGGPILIILMLERRRGVVSNKNDSCSFHLFSFLFFLSIKCVHHDDRYFFDYIFDVRYFLVVAFRNVELNIRVQDLDSRYSYISLIFWVNSWSCPVGKILFNNFISVDNIGFEVSDMKLEKDRIEKQLEGNETEDIAIEHRAHIERIWQLRFRWPSTFDLPNGTSGIASPTEIWHLLDGAIYWNVVLSSSQGVSASLCSSFHGKVEWRRADIKEVSREICWGCS